MAWVPLLVMLVVLPVVEPSVYCHPRPVSPS